MSGVLIVLEGAEGVGKTTQARRLADLLAQHGIDCSYLREPGGTSLGEAIREALLERSHSIAAAAEALLFMASRAQLIRERVVPALKSGGVVLLDRFFLSTYAYQIHGRGLPEGEVRAANQLAVGDVVPTVTLVLELPSSEGLARAGSRSGHDYMEQLGVQFHARVEAAFRDFVTASWQRAHPECGPIVPIDASGSADHVFERVAHAIAAFAPQLQNAIHPSTETVA